MAKDRRVDENSIYAEKRKWEQQSGECNTNGISAVEMYIILNVFYPALSWELTLFSLYTNTEKCIRSSGLVRQ